MILLGEASWVWVGEGVSTRYGVSVLGFMELVECIM